VVPLKAIRRLARRNGKIEVFRVLDTTLDARDLQKVTYHIRAKRGALLFARCWLLVEGETEFTMLPELARTLGHDFDLAGVCCVEFAQCGLKPLIKAAQDLGIEWHLLADGDKAGDDYAKTATGLLGGAPAADRITSIAEPDIEHCLWHGGYKSVYENAVDKNHKAMVKSTPGTAQYPTEVIDAAIRSTSKPHLSYAIVAAAAQVGSTALPATLKTGIEAAIKLAGRLV
jgi:putative ATP-dependent endonuclease of OLD family